MKKSVAVWLILREMASLPGCKYLIPGILLQQRAETETVNGEIVPQSNPFFCQPTFNGKVDGEDTIEDTIKKEAEEELGPRFAKDFYFPKLISFGEEKFEYGGEFVGFNFLGSISKEQAKLIQLHDGALPNFHIITKGTLSRVKPKSSGADPKTGIVLFDDQFKVLQRLFQLREALSCLG